MCSHWTRLLADLLLYLRQRSDWPTHGLVSHPDETHGHLLYAHLLLAATTTATTSTTVGLQPQAIGTTLGQEVVDLLGHLPEVAHGLLAGQGLVLARAEDAREEGGQEPAQRQVGISYGEGATFGFTQREGVVDKNSVYTVLPIHNTVTPHHRIKIGHNKLINNRTYTYIPGGPTDNT